MLAYKPGLPSLYVHVPFCVSRCSYCDFHSRAVGAGALETASGQWLSAIDRHLVALRERFGGAGFETIYIGGGTPSCLPSHTLRKALAAIGSAARAGTHPLEWSVEANPEDIGDGFLDTLADAGVDRLSVGVQSLEDAARTIAGRRGDASGAKKRLESIAARWKGRWSADLIYGLPGQSPEGLARDSSYLAGLGIGHVSLYELTLEEGTPLWRMANSGDVSLPDEDERADGYDAAAQSLAAAGLRRYEVSNWSIPGQECLHNEMYWGMGDWLALGPSGVGNVSMPDGSYLRIENAVDDDAYFADPTGTAHERIVSGIDAAFESLMTALRSKRGFDIGRFSERFGFDAFDAFGRLHERYPDLVGIENGRWVATDRGLDMLNVVLISALTEAERFYSAFDNDAGGKVP